jgi:hypothetical protein
MGLEGAYVKKRAWEKRKLLPQGPDHNLVTCRRNVSGGIRGLHVIVVPGFLPQTGVGEGCPANGSDFIISSVIIVAPVNIVTGDADVVFGSCPGYSYGG